MSTHSPGPWRCLNAVEVYASNNHLVATLPVHPSGTMRETVADSRLIEAAPEMLEALQDAEDTIGRLTSDNSEFDDIAHRIRTAIAKATGGAQ